MCWAAAWSTTCIFQRLINGLNKIVRNLICPGVGSGNLTTNELLNLVRDVKGNKSFYRCISSKKRTRKNVSSLLDRARDLVSFLGHGKGHGMSLTTSKSHPEEIPGPWDLGPIGKFWSKEGLTLIGGESVREHINNLDVPKALIPDGTHLWLLRELDNVTVRSLSIIFERLQQSGGVSENWRRQISSLSSRRAIRCMKESYSLVSLPLISGRRMGHTILEIISKHMKDK